MKFNYLFYFCDGIGSVFDSQVFTLLKAIGERKIFKKVYLFMGCRNGIRKNKFLTDKYSTGIEIVFFNTYPNYPIFNYHNQRSIQKALNTQKINYEEVIFHTRGEMVAWHLSEVVGYKYTKNIIPDVRGASVEEVVEYHNVNRVLKYFKVSNNRLAFINLNKFGKISVVSGSLKEYLIENYNVSSENIFVTPSLAGNDFNYDIIQREKMRKKLALNEDDLLVVFSSGGSAKWQNNDVIIPLAKLGLKVLNLSKKQIVHRGIINKFVNYSQVPAYLNAADAAIIWRDKSTVNKIASPVKFSEYICCGLPVIANHSVDMISNYITEKGCGLLTDDFSSIDQKSLKGLIKKDRNKISEEGRLNYGIDTIVNKYLQIYSSINN